MIGAASTVWRGWRWLSLLALLAATARAQDVFVHLELRVSSSGAAGTVVIDRGESDGVAVGDLVNFFPRSGGILRGAVSELRDRSAVVQMHGGNAAPALGTRGEVLLPKARLQPKPAPKPQPPAEPPPTPKPEPEEPAAHRPEAMPPDTEPPPAQPEAAPETGGQEPAPRPLPKPVWHNPDQGFTQDMPLLAQVRPVKPSERPTRITGRAYVGSDVVYSPHESLDNSFFRVGTDLDVENPFGRGGALHFAGDLGYRTEWDEDSGTKVLPRDISYHEGGTRFESYRWQAGRFLQYGVPEFGLLDGFEWTQRRANGDHYGASIGWLPELNANLESFEDFQLAGFYQWALDKHGQDSITAGFQTTWHHWSSDRQLMLLKGQHTPLDDWQYFGSFWIDFYDGRDNNKGPVELTQALVTASRQWQNQNGVEFAYRRITFQETLRNEFLPILAKELADNHVDRLSASGWRWLHADRRLHGEVGGYVDEADIGGYGEIGYELRDWLVEDGSVDFTAFATAGQFTNAFGLRGTLTKTTENGSWDLFCEVADHHQHGFPPDSDDVIQTRLRASRNWYWAAGWSLSVFGEGLQWDDQLGWSLGFHLERRF